MIFLDGDYYAKETSQVVRQNLESHALRKVRRLTGAEKFVVLVESLPGVEGTRTFSKVPLTFKDLCQKEGRYDFVVSDDKVFLRRRFEGGFLTNVFGVTIEVFNGDHVNLDNFIKYFEF